MNAYVFDWRRVTPAIGLLLGNLENPRYTPDRRDTSIQTGHIKESDFPTCPNQDTSWNYVSTKILVFPVVNQYTYTPHIAHPTRMHT